MIDPAEPNQSQGQFDFGEVLHPVQFKDTLEERRQHRAAVMKFGDKHGEGHAEHMYEKGMEFRRSQANRQRLGMPTL